MFMMRYSVVRRVVAEAVGSGSTGERLAGGNLAIALLASTVATGAPLVATPEAVTGPDHRLD